MSTKALTKNFPKSDLLELRRGSSSPKGYEVVHAEQVGESRWYSLTNMVFRHEGELWQFTYREGLTELQDDIDPFEDYPGDAVQCVMVQPYVVNVTRYRPVEVETDPSVTAAMVDRVYGTDRQPGS